MTREKRESLDWHLEKVEGRGSPPWDTLLQKSWHEPINAHRTQRRDERSASRRPIRPTLCATCDYYLDSGPFVQVENMAPRSLYPCTCLICSKSYVLRSVHRVTMAGIMGLRSPPPPSPLERAGCSVPFVTIKGSRNGMSERMSIRVARPPSRLPRRDLTRPGCIESAFPWNTRPPRVVDAVMSHLLEVPDGQTPSTCGG